MGTSRCTRVGFHSYHADPPLYAITFYYRLLAVVKWDRCEIKIEWLPSLYLENIYYITSMRWWTRPDSQHNCEINFIPNGYFNIRCKLSQKCMKFIRNICNILDSLIEHFKFLFFFFFKYICIFFGFWSESQLCYNEQKVISVSAPMKIVYVFSNF